jgi:hypothetical protein
MFIDLFRDIDMNKFYGKHKTKKSVSYTHTRICFELFNRILILIEKIQYHHQIVFIQPIGYMTNIVRAKTLFVGFFFL